MKYPAIIEIKGLNKIFLNDIYIATALKINDKITLNNGERVKLLTITTFSNSFSKKKTIPTIQIPSSA
ncbi:hypothetical protein H702_03710 [Streptococcus equinus JB1]|uniref:Uncharacterized protein n=1 Tax=Streptococcus equinus JB1 TaxID=1294274 RepID=A0A091BUU9_STREI|nr:hypothetical protein H702_03710 [Streptococcus equinus JB1]